MARRSFGSTTALWQLSHVFPDLAERQHVVDFKLARRRGASDMITLDLTYPVLLHQPLMFDRLDAFNKDLYAEIAQQADDVEQHSSPALGVAIMEEGSIDLHGVEIDQTKP